MEPNEGKRINKFLSESGFCSRRAADKLIEEGRVTLNGVVPEIGTKVHATDDVRVDGKPITPGQEKPVYLAFNKPVGIVCTTDTKVEKDNIIDFIQYPKRIFPIGRLDKARCDPLISPVAVFKFDYDFAHGVNLMLSSRPVVTDC